MTDPTLRISLAALKTDAELIDCALENLGGLIGKVDIFLLNDESAIRFLGTRSEEAWPSVVVTARESDPLPASFRQGLVEDLLVLPPRALDLERMVRTHELMKALHELEDSTHGTGELVRKLQEDIILAQKIQRRLIREKFAPLGPLSVKSKYWCGLKSGGDYFDVFELPGSTHAGLILADSSSYALSTSLIGCLVQFSIHLSGSDFTEPGRVVEALFGKLREGMKEKDRLSLLYGFIDRKTYEFRFVSCGGVYLAQRGRDGKVEWAARGTNPPLALGAQVPETNSLHLQPGDRLLACTDGWGEALEEPVVGLMEGILKQDSDSQDLMNELAFRLRRKLEKESDETDRAEGEFPMPPQDCSVLLLDLAANTLRMVAKKA
jgi:hypothetical protein